MGGTLGIDVGGTTIKGALLVDGAPVATARSGPYTSRSIDAVREAIGSVLDDLYSAAGSGSAVDEAGLCVPGAVDDSTGLISLSANAPFLVGHSPADLMGERAGRVHVRVYTDVHAAAHDVAVCEHLRGRLLAVSIGTGVGASVLDCDGAKPRLLVVSGRSSGHLGQIDVTLEDEDAAPIGPDGGRGGLEAYIGLRALMNRYGCGPMEAATMIRPGEPPFRAIVRAIRIAHAIYRPDHVRLVGGIGVRMLGIADSLRAAVTTHLTRLARPGWTLACGTTDFHAAIGAARLAELS